MRHEEVLAKLMRK